MSDFKFDIRIVLVILFTAVSGLLAMQVSPKQPSERGWQDAPGSNSLSSTFDKFVHLRAKQQSKRLTLYPNHCYLWFTSNGSSNDAVPWFTKTALFGDIDYALPKNNYIWKTDYPRQVIFVANKATTITVRKIKDVASGRANYCGFKKRIVTQEPH